MCLCRSRIRQFRFWLRRHRDARRGGLRRSSLRCRWRYRRRRNRLAANRAQIAFDHRQPIDHVAERIVNGFEGILGVAIGLQLGEADVGQVALDHIDQTAVGRCRRATVSFGQGGKSRMLGFEMAQNVLQPLFDPPEIAGAVLGGRLQAFEQIGNPLFEMGESRCAVIADRHAVKAVGQRPQRALEMLCVFACSRPLVAFQHLGRAAASLGQGGKVRLLSLEMAQNVLQPILDPPEIAGSVIGGGVHAFQQIGNPLFEMGECGCVVVAGRHAVKAVGQRPQRALDLL